MNYEWDENKAASNLKKHSVDFEEATTVFNNPLALIFEDELQSSQERRDIIGHSRRNRLILVSLTERSTGIRIISARVATQREREDYENTTF